MKSDEELINSIIVNPANFVHISKTGRINGTLYTELKRVIKEVETREYNRFEYGAGAFNKSGCDFCGQPTMENETHCEKCACLRKF